MSLEAIKTINIAEEQAKQIKLDGNVRAENIVAEAHRNGEAAIAAARDRAKDDLVKLVHDSDAAIAQQTSELENETRKKLAEIDAAVNANLERAASLIVERIVNS